MFEKILIANRGEIAVRIIHACKEMGIASVAVYSQADRRALHTRLADEAVFIGPSESDQSYLSFDKILTAARQTGAQAVHPGYGFLSENAEFAQAAADAGIVFIGPPSSAVRAMGDKASARRLVQKVGVPVTPGYEGHDDLVSLTREADRLGFPLLVKASAGGGGKGMRVVWEKAEFEEAAEAARREALHSFGDDHLILERYIPKAHHVEFQVLGDQHGSLLHLLERECSVQRRHQKIIEETPSTLLDDNLRLKMGEAAVAAARAAGYQNAGTVEFIVDPETRQFFFLEMNTRLQVEHPITELLTGVDLVQWQIRIAAGEPLSFSQEEILPRGHSIECRLYAEDPSINFLPASGPLLRFIEPRGPGVRVDSGFLSGDEITVHYDPLIAKIIVHSEDRPGAIRKMVEALQDTVVLGLTSNSRFLLDVLAHPDFQAGKVHTTWIEQTFDEWQHPQCPIPPEVLAAAALTQFQDSGTPYGLNIDFQSHGPDPFSPWRASSSFRTGE